MKLVDENCSGLSLMIEHMSKIAYIIRSNKVQISSPTQLLAECNGARRRGEGDNFFRNPRYDGLSSQYSTKSDEEGLRS